MHLEHVLERCNLHWRRVANKSVSDSVCQSYVLETPQLTKITGACYRNQSFQTLLCCFVPVSHGHPAQTAAGKQNYLC